MNLRNTRIVVTGASRGLGRALACKFAEEGAHLALCARTYDDLNRLSLELSVRGTPPFWSVCDISDPGQVDSFASGTLAALGGVDILVNNASMLGPRAEIVEWTRSAWDRVIDVNVNGLFYVTRAFLPSMLGQRSGSIINVGSSVGRKGRRRWGAYAASKFAVEGFTQTLADEVWQHGVRVNSVNPGPLNTDMRHAAYPEEDRSKLPFPTEVLDVFLYLASPQSSSVNGQSFDAQEFSKIRKESL